MRITPGFRPTVKPPVSFQPVEPQGRVIFLDSNHEFYVPIDRKFPSATEQSTIRVTKENNHSVRVDIDQKKK